MPADRPLTPLQDRFCLEYLVDHNATQAAIRAGASPRSASVTAARWLGKAKVQERIAELSQRQQERLGVEADDVLRELMRLAFSDPRKLYRADGTLKLPSEWDDDTAAAISAVETDETTVGTDPSSRITTRTHKVKRWDKLSALDKLGKYLGLWRDALDLHLKGPPFKVYMGFDPREALGQPQTSPTSAGPTGPTDAPST